ncbi:MAG: hypothetical protein KBA64_12340 [Armatimonadetes bacterium]|nr:hypothetical protein [Armatimonadota bacterium]MDI9603047.1 hypothetical protein [Acidobacteriota bacterium]NLN91482.1 hypothetical protein [candidate division WS1 bacterium]
MPPHYWEPGLRRQFPPEYNLLVYWRIAFAMAMLMCPGVGFLLIQAEVTREAAAGNALVIAEPRLWPVAAIAAGLVLSIPAAAVLHFIINDTPKAARAVLMHDAFHCVLLTVLVWGCWANAPLPVSVRGGLSIIALCTGVLTAEGVWVALRTARVWAAGGLSVVYLATLGAAAPLLWR